MASRSLQYCWHFSKLALIQPLSQRVQHMKCWKDCCWTVSAVSSKLFGHHSYNCLFDQQPVWLSNLVGEPDWRLSQKMSILLCGLHNAPRKTWCFYKHYPDLSKSSRCSSLVSMKAVKYIFSFIGEKTASLS